MGCSVSKTPLEKQPSSNATFEFPSVYKSSTDPECHADTIWVSQPDLDSASSDSGSDVEIATGLESPQAGLKVAISARSGVECQAAVVTHLGNPGFKKENQDTAFCQAHGFGGQPSGSLFGIFDGHGVGGMAISQHCSQLLPYFICLALEEAYQNKAVLTTQETIQVEEALVAAFLATEEEICCARTFSTYGSGTTATVAHLQGRDLWVASVGDSRALLLTRPAKTPRSSPFAPEAHKARNQLLTQDGARVSEPDSPASLISTAWGAEQPAGRQDSAADRWPAGQAAQQVKAAAVTDDSDLAARPACMTGDDSIMDLLDTTDLDLPQDSPAGSPRSSASSHSAITKAELFSRKHTTAELPPCAPGTQPAPEHKADILVHCGEEATPPAVLPSLLVHSRSKPALEAPVEEPLEAIQLTMDHRPGEPSEMARLLAAGGRVQPKRLRNGQEAGEPRLWLPDRNAPGLLVSRAIGDDLASTVGCTAHPTVQRRELQPQDEYLVIASDGVWDMMPNEQVTELVDKHRQPKEACKAILQQALAAWRCVGAGDNIAVLVVRFAWDGQQQADDASFLSSPTLNTAHDVPMAVDQQVHKLDPGRQNCGRQNHCRPSAGVPAGGWSSPSRSPSRGGSAAEHHSSPCEAAGQQSCTRSSTPAGPHIVKHPRRAGSFALVESEAEMGRCSWGSLRAP